jgi:hypothetical protein
MRVINGCPPPPSVRNAIAGQRVIAGQRTAAEQRAIAGQRATAGQRASAPVYVQEAMYPPAKIVRYSTTERIYSPAGQETTVSLPAAAWVIPHTLGRRPNVTVYDALGNVVIADVHSTNNVVTVIFAAPTTGTAVLS